MTSALFGVVTAIGRPEYDLIEKAAESLADLVTSTGLGVTALQWVVALDGPLMGAGPNPDSGIVARHSAKIRSIAAATIGEVEIVLNAMPGGSALARNTALDEIRAPWMLTLDGDDVLVAEGVLAMLDAVRTHPESAWAAGRCPHMNREGQEIWAGPEDPFPPGPIAPGEFWSAKRRLGGLPFVCAATLARTDAVRQCGGWPSRPRPRAADTALWAVLTSRFSGVWVPEVVYRYRRHDASVTMQPGFRDHDERLAEIEMMIAAGTTQIG